MARPHPTVDECSRATARNIRRAGALWRAGGGGGTEEGDFGGPGFWCRPAVIRRRSAPGRPDA